MNPLTIALIGAGGYWLYKSKNAADQAKAAVAAAKSALTKVVDVVDESSTAENAAKTVQGLHGQPVSIESMRLGDWVAHEGWNSKHHLGDWVPHEGWNSKHHLGAFELPFGLSLPVVAVGGAAAYWFFFRKGRKARR